MKFYMRHYILINQAPERGKQMILYYFMVEWKRNSFGIEIPLTFIRCSWKFYKPQFNYTFLRGARFQENKIKSLLPCQILLQFYMIFNGISAQLSVKIQDKASQG
jgi:hypothetical protein